jgi:hypothetical protein
MMTLSPARTNSAARALPMPGSNKIGCQELGPTRCAIPGPSCSLSVLRMHAYERKGGHTFGAPGNDNVIRWLDRCNYNAHSGAVPNDPIA